MAHLMIPVLILLVVLLGGFMVWEVYFAKRGQQAITEQHHDEGHDDPPKTI